jgi:hypothetical protein
MPPDKSFSHTSFARDRISQGGRCMISACIRMHFPVEASQPGCIIIIGLDTSNYSINSFSERPFTAQFNEGAIAYA